jgi:hypothetical protein
VVGTFHPARLYWACQATRSSGESSEKWAAAVNADIPASALLTRPRKSLPGVKNAMKMSSLHLLRGH